MEINFTKLDFTLELQSDVSEPYLLFEIRKDFAQIFRRTIGCERVVCEKCSNDGDCAYRQIFSQEMNPDPSAIKRFQKPPLPFVFDPPILPLASNMGSHCEFGLTLVGIAVNHLVKFLDAVGFMFGHEDSRWTKIGQVVKIESVDYLGNRTIICQQGSGIVLDRIYMLSMEGLEKSTTISGDKVTLCMATPMRIVKDGQPLRTLTFSDLVMSLLRRMTAIAFYYCYSDLALDYKWLSRESQNIGIDNNGFRWEECKHAFSGVLGSVTFTGNLAEFIPFLLFGEYFHAGKGAAYGNGRYRLDNIH